MRNALGYGFGKTNNHRNYFVAFLDGDDYQEWMKLVGAGFATRHSCDAESEVGVTFSVDKNGMAFFEDYIHIQNRILEIEKERDQLSDELNEA